MKKEQRYTPARELRVQIDADGSRTISGYAAVYNSPSQDLGGFTEIIAPGAFTKSLKDSPDVLALRDHDPKLLMGRTTSKTLTLTEDANGLRFVCKLPKTTQAADLAESIDRGDLDGVSFGFTTVEDKWTSDSQGNVVRTLVEVKLFEISPCSFPAYSATSVSVRSCPAEIRSLLKRSKRSNEDGCDCDCDACQGDDCERCSMYGCEDEACAENGCPQQDDDEDASSRSFIPEDEDLGRYMRVQLALRR